MLGPTILLTLIFHLQLWRVSAFSSVAAARKKHSAERTSMVPIVSRTVKNGTPVESSEEDENDAMLSRRSVLKQILTVAAVTVTTTVTTPSDACNAATPKSNIDPETAYMNLRKAREELVFAGRKYFPKRDWEGLREYLSNDDSYLNNYDANADLLLRSKRLDIESKQAIGTIRRYGVGADVIIMYGGLKAELSEDNEELNSAEIEKYYVKTLDSLEEVIAIVRSNPGFSSIE